MYEVGTIIIVCSSRFLSLLFFQAYYPLVVIHGHLTFTHTHIHTHNDNNRKKFFFF